MKITAEIEPNDRKYYGTEIKLTTEDGREAFFVVWVNGISDYKPSSREIDFVGEDGKFYVYSDPYSMVDDHTIEEYVISDDHYETEAAYKICQKIVEALDGLEV